jgi:hypothetical protein
LDVEAKASRLRRPRLHVERVRCAAPGNCCREVGFWLVRPAVFEVWKLERNRPTYNSPFAILRHSHSARAGGAPIPAICRRRYYVWVGHPRCSLEGGSGGGGSGVLWGRHLAGRRGVKEV